MMRRQKYNAPEMEVMEFQMYQDVMCTSISIDYDGVITDPTDPNYNPDDLD